MNLHPEIFHLLIVLSLFQLKHFVCDGPLQSKAMVDQKSIYGATLGLAHSAIHGAGTLAVVLLSGFGGLIAVGMAVADAVVHYHIDFGKENIIKAQGWTVKDGPFWWALSADQMLHQFTYLIVAAFLFQP